MRTIPAGIRPLHRLALAVGVISLVIAAACAAPAASPSPTPSPTPPDATAPNRATAAAWVDAVLAKDAAALAALFAPNGTFDDPPEHRPDRAGVQATYAEVFAYEQLAVDPAVVLVGAEGAVVSWTFTWCNASIDPCPSAHVNGAGGVSVLRMTDGVITNETLYYITGGEPY